MPPGHPDSWGHQISTDVGTAKMISVDVDGWSLLSGEWAIMIIGFMLSFRMCGDISLSKRHSTKCILVHLCKLCACPLYNQPNMFEDINHYVIM